MRGKGLRALGLPVVLLATLGACASNAVPAGVVYTSGVPSGSGPGPAGGGPTYGNGGYQNTTPVSSTAPAPAQGAYVGETGRVVSIREVALQGNSGMRGPNNGTFMGGLLGAMSGATVGAATSRTVGGGIVGGLIGLVGGAIVGTIAGGSSGGQGFGSQGIEVTVQRDDGQQVTIAQRDEGDIQLGDRVQIVQNSQGVPQVVRDATRSPD